MHWDDLKFVAALAKAGSLAKAAQVLRVEHTTVGRRIDSAERHLGVKLFTRTPRGYVLTREGESLVEPLAVVEEAVEALERGISATRDEVEGRVRVTSPETLGIAYLAPRLTAFRQQHPSLQLELVPAGDVLDLNKAQAEIAVRTFRTRHERLVVREVGAIRFRLYATRRVLQRWPVKSARELAGVPLLAPTSGVDRRWLDSLVPRCAPVFTSEVSLALLAAARAHGGVAVLPAYLVPADDELVPVELPKEPVEPVYLTVHRDLRHTARVRALLDFLVATFSADRTLLQGR